MANRRKKTVPACRFCEGALCKLARREAKLRREAGRPNPPANGETPDEIPASDADGERECRRVAEGMPCRYPANLEPLPPVPKWDAHTRTLRLDGIVVKQFRQPADNQELVLAVFEESGWPKHIDDPIPPDGKRLPQDRLGATIWRLNRSQKHNLLRFHGDGKGEGVCWERVAETVASSKKRKRAC